MLDEKFIIKEFKTGKTILEIARTMHVATHVVSSIIRASNLPTQKIVNKILTTPGFKDFFINLYNSTDKFSDIREGCLKHPFFSNITRKSIDKRIYEIKDFFDLPSKLPENVYTSKYDRIRGYIIRNSKYMAKRRNIYFDLKYTDFELPKYCPILGVELEYGSNTDGNSPYHATLDRIDNSKGYVKDNVMVISRLANAMKNAASFEQLEQFITNYSLLIKHIKSQGTLGDITSIFPNWQKLSFDL